MYVLCNHYEGKYLSHLQHFRRSLPVPSHSIPTVFPRGSPYADLFHHRFVFPVLELRINEIIHHALLLSNLFSLNIFSLDIVEYKSGLFFLLLCNKIWICAIVHLFYCWWTFGFFLLYEHIFWRRFHTFLLVYTYFAVESLGHEVSLCLPLMDLISIPRPHLNHGL